MLHVAGEWKPRGWSFRINSLGTHDAGMYQAWLLRHESEEQPHTKVIQGPTEIIVTGNLGAFVFERPSGGLSLNFWSVGLQYAAEKVTAGEVFTYDQLAARRDLLAAIDRCVADEEMPSETAEYLKREAEELRYDDEGRVQEFYSLKIADEIPSLGQVYTSKFLMAIACIRAVHDYENREIRTCP